MKKKNIFLFFIGGLLLFIISFVLGQYTALKTTFNIFKQPEVICDYDCKTDDNENEKKEEKGFEGKFVQKATDVTPSNLKLDDETKTFELDINLCEGIAAIKGDYKIENDIIKLTFEPYQYRGFIGENNTSYEFQIINDDEIKFISSDIACGPFKNDTYKKSA